jgi:hypothetical protein
VVQDRPISSEEHRRLLERFANWHVLRRLRQTAAKEPVTSYRANNARRVLRVAEVLLVDLAGHGRCLNEWASDQRDSASRIA